MSAVYPFYYQKALRPSLVRLWKTKKLINFGYNPRIDNAGPATAARWMEGDHIGVKKVKAVQGRDLTKYMTFVTSTYQEIRPPRQGAVYGV